MNCVEFAEAFARGEVSDETRAHVRDCERCRSLIDALTADPADEAPSIDAALRAAEAEVERTKRRAWHREVWFIIVFALIPFSLLLSIPFVSGDLSFWEALAVGAAGFGIALIIGLPLLVILRMLSRLGSVNGRPLYKRLGPSALLSGVCVGISEATGWNVTLIRLAFFIAIWMKGLGIFAYVICDLVMKVHPADREHLLRFRIRRAVRNFLQFSRS